MIEGVFIYETYYHNATTFSNLYTCWCFLDWQDDPVITVINTTSYPISNIEYPAITICSQGLAKDIMENVMLQQFENYLISKKLIEEHDANSNQSQNSNTTVPKTFDNLTAEEVS